MEKILGFLYLSVRFLTLKEKKEEKEYRIQINICLLLHMIKQEGGEKETLAFAGTKVRSSVSFFFLSRKRADDLITDASRDPLMIEHDSDKEI